MAAPPAPAPTPAAQPDIPFTRAQSEYLDLLRGLAAQLVLLQHAFQYCFPGQVHGRLGLGALGVQIFFLLSGFLITHTVMTRVRRGTYDFGEFMISRVCRIYTPYVPAILLVAILDFYSSQSATYEYRADYTVGTGIANMLMLQDFPLFQILRRLHVPDLLVFAKTFGSGRQFWTVSIEWWIYVTVGLLAAFRVHRGLFPPLLVALLALAAIVPLYNLVGGPGNSLTFTWIVGGAVNHAFAQPASGKLPGRRGCAAIWLGFVALAGIRLIFTHGQVYDAIFTLMLAGIVFVPFLAYGHVAGPSLAHRLWLDRPAFHSYSLYLTHGSIVVFMMTANPALFLGWQGVAAIVLITNLVAIPFACAFELPHRYLRQFLLSTTRSGTILIYPPPGLGDQDGVSTPRRT